MGIVLLHDIHSSVEPLVITSTRGHLNEALVYMLKLEYTV